LRRAPVNAATLIRANSAALPSGKRRAEKGSRLGCGGSERDPSLSYYSVALTFGRLSFSKCGVRAAETAIAASDPATTGLYRFEAAILLNAPCACIGPCAPCTMAASACGFETCTEAGDNQPTNQEYDAHGFIQ
jgi:hypothetical protein